LREARRPAVGLTVAVFGILVVAAPCGSAVAADGPQSLPTQSLEIVTKNGVYPFVVEVAQTDAERAKGLMFRRSLPDGRGMLFDFKQEQPVAFWMRNTYVPLDMIFIAGDGRIVSIAENTKPLSEDLIPSRGPVRGVLEVIAGTADRLGIRPGDQVANPIFGRR
jgi:uncharacterized protein